MATDEQNKTAGGITARALALGILLCGVVAWATVLRDSRGDEAYPSANLLPAMPYLALVAGGLLLNPLLRRRKRWIRPFSASELLLIFVMSGVSAGLASWGLSGALIPRLAALSNPAWNTDQSQWDIYVVPFVNEDYVLSADGTQAAARKLYDAHRAYEETRDRYRAARDLLAARGTVARFKAEAKRIAALADPAERKAEEKSLAWPRSRAERLLAMAEDAWAAVGGEEDPQVVADTYEPRIALLKEQRDARRDALRALNAEAAEETVRVRKGLPEGQRALPGFLLAPGEGWASYQARLRRLKVGSRALAELGKADATLARSIAGGTPLPGDWPDRVDAVADRLASIARIEPLEKRQAELSDELAKLEERVAAQQAEQRRLRQLRRYAEQDRFEEYDTWVGEVERSTAELEQRVEERQTRLDKWIKPQLAVCDGVAETRDRLHAIAADARTARPDDYGPLRTRLLEQKASFRGFDATARRFWLGDIRWGRWVKPLLNWIGLAFLVYLLFMSFNALIYRQWAHNEKLIYPIAEVTTLLAGAGEENPERGPALFRNGLFWTGVVLSAGILGWNHLAENGVIPNVSSIKLQFLWLKYVGGGMFKGLGSTYFCIIFAVVGLTFLVPSNISFSLWFFELLYMMLLLVMTWMGYGNNRWSLGNPARFEVGSGAMLVFGLVVLWTCRQYLLCAFRPAGVQGLPEDEQRELRVSSGLFLGTSLALVLLMIFRFGANPFYAVLFYLMSVIATLALIRAVTEGGVLSMERVFGASGLMAVLFGTAHAWTSPKLFVPFAIVTAIMFGGVKVFIASAMANAFKIRDEMNIRRPTFHLAIWAGILTTVVVASVTLIILCYDRGANALDGWMHTYNARQWFNGIKGAMAGAGGPVDPTKRNWFFVGIVLMTGLLLARQKFFGVPHPLGLVMLMNPVMFGFWGSILIGWSCKSIVSKYCNKEQYGSIRGFFVGLVIGHLAAVLFGWARMDWHWG